MRSSKKIIQAILFFSFIIFSFNAFSQKTSYNELVFPPEINEYPLLFTDYIEYEVAGKTETWDNPAQTKLAIREFIKAQKESRNIQHQMVSTYKLKNYSVDSFRFLVKTTQYTGYNWASRNYATSPPEFIIIDRQNGKKYAHNGSVGSKKPKGSTYANYDVVPETTKRYFKDFTRVLKNLDKHGAEKTFKKEWRKQSSPRYLFWGLVATMTISAPAIAIIGDF